MIEQEFFDKMVRVWAELSTLQEYVVRIESAMSTLERQGMTSATVHIRKDNGGMELLHPSGSDYERQTGRRREYIGKKAEAQEAAKARVERFQTYHKLKDEWSKKSARRVEIYRQIERLELVALGKQAKLFSEVGTIQPGQPGQTVPIDYNRLTPAQVIDYFKNSTVLSVHAKDVERQFSSDEWSVTAQL